MVRIETSHTIIGTGVTVVEAVRDGERNARSFARELAGVGADAHIVSVQTDIRTCTHLITYAGFGIEDALPKEVRV